MIDNNLDDDTIYESIGFDGVGDVRVLQRRVSEGEGSMMHLASVVREIGVLEDTVGNLVMKELDTWKTDDELSRKAVEGVITYVKSIAKCRQDFSKVISTEVTSDLEGYIKSIREHLNIINNKMGNLFGKLTMLKTSHDRALANYQNNCKGYFGAAEENVFTNLIKEIKVKTDEALDPNKSKLNSRTPLEEVKNSHFVYVESCESLNKELNEQEEEMRVLRTSFLNLDEERLSVMKKALTQMARAEQTRFVNIEASTFLIYTTPNSFIINFEKEQDAAITYEDSLNLADRSIKVVKFLYEMLLKIAMLQENIAAKYQKLGKVASNNLLFVEGPTFQRAWLKVLSYFEYQSKVHLEMSGHIKEKFAIFLSSVSSDIQAKRRSIDLALGNSTKAKISEQKKLEAADAKYTKVCSVLKNMEAELTRENEEHLSSPEKKPFSSSMDRNASNQAIIKNLGKLLGTEPKSVDVRIQALQEQIKNKKILANDIQQELKAAQVNVKLAEQAHQSLLVIIQNEMKASLGKNFSNINDKIVELLHFYHGSEEKIKLEQFEVLKNIDQIDNGEDILDFGRENASELNFAVDIIPLPDKIKAELKIGDSPLRKSSSIGGSPSQNHLMKPPLSRENKDEESISYEVSFPGKNLGIKFRRQGEKLIVRKLNNEDNEETNDQVRLGSEVVAIDGMDVTSQSGDEVIDKIRNSPRPINITFSYKKSSSPIKKNYIKGSPRKITTEPGKDALTQLTSPNERTRRISRTARETLSAEDVTFQVMFGLPPEEVVLASFSCAFYPNSFPHQGRLEVSKHFLGFHATWGGNCHPRLIALKDIIILDRKSTVSLFPNAIKVVTKSNKTYFFGNFIFRDKAYELIQKISGAKPSEEDNMGGDGNNSHSSIMPLDGGVIGGEGELGDGYISEKDVDESKSVDTSADLEGYKLIAEGDIEASVPHCKLLFYSDENKFIEKLGSDAGETNFSSQAWKEGNITLRGETFSHSRSITYNRSVNVLGTVRVGKVCQLQVHRMEGEKNRDKLVIVTQNEVQDLPFSDCFKVQCKWIFCRLPKSSQGLSRCHVKMGINIDMLKTGFLIPSSIIQSESTTQTEAFMKNFIKEANVLIKKMRNSASRSRRQSDNGKAVEAEPPTTSGNSAASTINTTKQSNIIVQTIKNNITIQNLNYSILILVFLYMFLQVHFLGNRISDLENQMKQSYKK